jgi:hypothetical protein
MMNVIILFRLFTLGIKETKHNDNQHKSFTPSITVSSAECLVFYCYADCHYAECHYAECRYPECRGAAEPA